MLKVVSISIILVSFWFFNDVLAQKNDKEALLNGVTQLPLPDENTRLSATYIINTDSEIIAVFGLPEFNIKFNMVATSRLGKGKVMILSSPAYFSQQMLKDAEVAKFIRNTIEWGRRKTNGKVQVGLFGKIDQGLELTFGKKYNFETLTDLVDKPKTEIIFINQDVKDSVQLKKLESFINEGGTLIFGSPYDEIFRQGNRKPGPASLLINKLFVKAGLFNAYTLLSSSKENNKLELKAFPAYLHPKTLFPYLIQTNYTTLDPMAKAYLIEPTIELIFSLSEPNSPIFKQIKLDFKCSDVVRIPSPSNPIAIATNQQKWAYIFEQKFEDINTKYKDELYLSTNAKTFPGEVPQSTIRINDEINIPVKVGNQGLYSTTSLFFKPHSTGFYVPAGEKVKITIADALIGQRLKIQIGAHNDDLMHLEELKRDGSDLTRDFELNKTEVEVFSPYGGLLFLKIADTSKLKTIKIKVDGAIRSPYFKLNETSEEDWKRTIRNYQAPWAELATDKIVLTVPSYRIRNLDNPAALMKFWDKVMDADAELANIDKNRLQVERIIVDEQTAFGSMFAAPDRIVVPDDESCKTMLDLEELSTTGSWGHFHELGHRHQFMRQDFNGLMEVTVNLYSMYIYDKVLKKGIYNHPNIASKEVVKKRIADYLSNNPTFEKWTKDPFTALCMYIQLIEGFGWEPILMVNKTFRNLDNLNHMKPSELSDADKIDLWFVNICKATNSNLTDFFARWRIPVSEKAKKDVATLKFWLPEQFLKNNHDK
jgi:hypothetical protein